MPAFKDPGFQERASAAAEARGKALGKLRARPVADEATLAAGRERHAAREAAEAERRAAASTAREQAAVEKLAIKANAVAAAEKLASAPELSDAERKVARDARYAARKNRKQAR